MRIVTWNLYHGRAVATAGVPAPNHDLFAAFAERLADWEWDVALLQECPPWWPADLGRACGAHARMALTSRNQLFALRRFAGRRWPLTMKSGGGCNAILVRGGTVAAHRRARLRWLPEQRVVHAVRWEPAGVWLANLHAQVGSPAAAYEDAGRAARAVLGWSDGMPAVLGGDANVREPRFPGFDHVGGRKVDHVFARGWRAIGVTDVLERGTLSDHAPLRVTLAEAPTPPHPV